MTEKNQNNSIQINMQYIKDMSFEAPEMPISLLQIKSAPAININVDLNAQKTNNEKCFTVDLTVRVQAQNKETNKTLFLCELTYGALATLDIPADKIEPVLMVEIPHMIFPYARQIVGNMIQQAGFPALQINPIDFLGLYQQKKAQAQAENKKEEA